MEPPKKRKFVGADDFGAAPTRNGVGLETGGCLAAGGLAAAVRGERKVVTSPIQSFMCNSSGMVSPDHKSRGMISPDQKSVNNQTSCSQVSDLDGDKSDGDDHDVVASSEGLPGGTAVNPARRNRRKYSIDFKVSVLEGYYHDPETRGNQRKTAIKYGVNRRQIQKWLAQETSLREQRDGNLKGKCDSSDMIKVGAAVKSPPMGMINKLADKSLPALIKVNTTKAPVPYYTLGLKSPEPAVILPVNSNTPAVPGRYSTNSSGGVSAVVISPQPAIPQHSTAASITAVANGTAATALMTNGRPFEGQHKQPASHQTIAAVLTAVNGDAAGGQIHAAHQNSAVTASRHLMTELPPSRPTSLTSVSPRSSSGLFPRSISTSTKESDSGMPIKLEMKEEIEEPINLSTDITTRASQTGPDTVMARSHADPLSTHILDTGVGKPAHGVQVHIYRMGGGTPDSPAWMKVNSKRTNEDGRASGFLTWETFHPGTYKLHFNTGEYYAKTNTSTFYPFAEVVFQIEDPTSHYHVPLLLSPYSYSTYRGS